MQLMPQGIALGRFELVRWKMPTQLRPIVWTFEQNIATDGRVKERTNASNSTASRILAVIAPNPAVVGQLSTSQFGEPSIPSNCSIPLSGTRIQSGRLLSSYPSSYTAFSI